MPAAAKTITVADLAEEIGMSVPALSLLISAECREHGSDSVVHTAKSSNRASLIHAEAADRIRTRITSRAA